MGKQPQLMKKEKLPTRKIDTTIAVAVIGLCGTLVTALLASPALVAWINQTTQPPTITPIEPEIMTATIPASTTPPTLTSVPVGQDWKSILSLDLSQVPGSDCPPRLLPPTIDPGENTSLAVQQLEQAFASNEDLNWLIAPSPHPEVHRDGFATLRISSIVTETQWVQISNELLIDVTAQGGLPEHVNVLAAGECGGIGEIRIFPSFNLTNEFDVYGLKSTFTEADYFTLQPGEFEEFMTPFECKAVGIYQFKVNVSYVYSNISGVTDSDQTFGFVCPQSFTSWFYDTQSNQFLSSNFYQWNGTGYERNP